MSCMEQTRSKPTPRLLPQSFIKGLRTFNPRWLSFPPSQVCNLQFEGRPLCIIVLFCPQSGLGMGPWLRRLVLVETVRNYLKKRYGRNPRLCGTSGSREFRLFLNLAQTHVSMSKQLKDCDIETVCVWFCWQLFQVNQLFASINIDVSQAAASTHFEPSCQG